LKFTIITHAEHKLHKQKIVAYEPYVREMNLWLKYVDEVIIVAPISNDEITTVESKYLIEQIASAHTPRNDETKRHSERSEAISSKEKIASVHTPRNDGSKEIKLIKIPSFDITSTYNGIKALFKIPKITYQIYKAMQWADHIHVRCPGNIGLLGCLVQIVFPNKPKTVKYAGNWDPNSKQPLSYKLQKWILSNTFLTKNCKVLVYGEWPNQSKNIVPFFTATYSKQEIEAKRHSEHSEVISSKEQIASSHTPRNDETNRHSECSEAISSKEQIASSLNPRNDETKRHSERSEAISSKEQIASSLTPRNDETKRYSQPNLISQTAALKFIYVGGLTSGKQPLLSVKVIHQLKEKGYNVHLDIYGDGEERKKLEAYIEEHQLQKHVVLNGNKSKELIKKAYQEAHFLLFVSKSEGWPKVVAEAMFWGCLPITSRVSCTPYMLGNGSRGAIVNFNCEEIVQVIQNYLTNGQLYKSQVQSAMQWSRQFTLEKFEEEIGKLL
jgi:glycosyltransferase involved in cell wall biosynthesis